MLKKIREKRAKRKALRAKRKDEARHLQKLIDTRRAKAEERRKSIHKRKGDKARIQDFTKKDPKTPAGEKRIEQKELDLKAEMDELHKQITAAGDRLDDLDKQIERVEGLVDRTKKRIGAITKSIRKAKRKALKQSGAEMALKRAKKDDGKTEQPMGSNWGGIVTKMILFTGYTSAVYWCGCAMCFWAIKYGLGTAVSRIRRGYAGFVEADARANTNGLKYLDPMTANPPKGGWGSCWNNEHVVGLTGRVVNGMIETMEGNTSHPGGSGGSETNGDSCAYGKLRYRSDFDCFAVQEYDH